MAATACLRDEAPRDVPARVISVDRFVAERQSDVDEDEAARFEAVARGWALLGLQKERDYESVLSAYYDTVGAFYDPSEDEITILHRGRALDGDDVIATLVHEFSHALQHDAVDDDDEQRWHLTTDARLASSAVFEGDATRTTDHSIMLMYDADPSVPNWRRVYDTWKRTRSVAYREEPLRITLAGRYFVYAFGSGFTEAVASKARSRYLSEVYDWMREPPLTVRGILAGPEAARRRDEAVRSAYEGLPIQEPSDASGAAPRDTETLSDAGTLSDSGTLNDAAMLNDAAIPVSAHNAASDGGRGAPSSRDASDGGEGTDVRWLGPDLLLPEVSGHDLLDADTLGAFVLEAYAVALEREARELGAGEERLVESISELVTDSLTVWQSKERMVVILRMQFEGKSAPKRWQRALVEVQPGKGHVRTFIDQDTLVVVSSTDETWLVNLTLDELRWHRRTPEDVAGELYPEAAASDAALRSGAPGNWKLRLRGGCVRRPAALLDGVNPGWSRSGAPLE